MVLSGASARSRTRDAPDGAHRGEIINTQDRVEMIASHVQHDGGLIFD